MHHGYAYKKTDKKKINSKIDRNKKSKQTTLCINTLEPFRISELPMLQST